MLTQLLVSLQSHIHSSLALLPGPLEQVLEHPMSPNIIDATTSGSTYNSFAGLNYLQYTSKHFACPPSAVSRRYVPLTLSLSFYVLTSPSLYDRHLMPLARLLSFYVLVFPFLCDLQRVSCHLVAFILYTDKFPLLQSSACR